MKSSFQVKKAKREAVFLKLGIAGGAGSGKSYSALKLAKGLCDKWSDVIIIDTENGSANLYSHLGEYQVIPFQPPFSPQRYVDAINYAITLNPKVIIIDSISHEWEGIGGCLDIKSSIPGNEYVGWNKVTPLHNHFLSAILQSPVHIITTCRKKTDYTLQTNDKGKIVPVKMGLRHCQREGYDYEITIDFELDSSHLAVANKDRTGLFSTDTPFLIDESIGLLIRQWNSGMDVTMPLPLLKKKSDVLDKLKSLNIPREKYDHLIPLLKAHEAKLDWNKYSGCLQKLEEDVILPFSKNGHHVELSTA